MVQEAFVKPTTVLPSSSCICRTICGVGGTPSAKSRSTDVCGTERWIVSQSSNGFGGGGARSTPPRTSNDASAARNVAVSPERVSTKGVVVPGGESGPSKSKSAVSACAVSATEERMAAARRRAMVLLLVRCRSVCRARRWASRRAAAADPPARNSGSSSTRGRSQSLCESRAFAGSDARQETPRPAGWAGVRPGRRSGAGAGLGFGKLHARPNSAGPLRLTQSPGRPSLSASVEWPGREKRRFAH
jgi:hypothetical protein